MLARPSTAGLQRLSRLLFQTGQQAYHQQQHQQQGLAPMITRITGGSVGTSAAVLRPRPWRGLATTPPPPSPPPALSPFDRWRRALAQAPPAALFLGALGVIPFVALATPVAKHLAPFLPAAVAEQSDLFQVGYGVSIASFLGGVHWGAALSSPLTPLGGASAAAGAAAKVAARMAAERLTWGVVPSLLAWPLVAMESGPAAALLSALLPALYLVDKRFAGRGLLPAWYMALRAPLTLGATFGCLLTATYHAHSEADRVAQAEAARERRKKKGEKDDSKA